MSGNYQINELIDAGVLDGTEYLQIDDGNPDYKKLLLSKSGIFPSEVSIVLSGIATEIDLSLYSRSVMFKFTLTADSTFFFSNRVSGQSGSIHLVQDGSTKYACSYGAGYIGDTIDAPEIAGIDVISYVISSATGSALPSFGVKTLVE